MRQFSFIQAQKERLRVLHRQDFMPCRNKQKSLINAWLPATTGGTRKRHWPSANTLHQTCVVQDFVVLPDNHSAAK